jgi:hypothetical protein
MQGLDLAKVVRMDEFLNSAPFICAMTLVALQYYVQTYRGGATFKKLRSLFLLGFLLCWIIAFVIDVEGWFRLTPFIILVILVVMILRSP